MASKPQPNIILASGSVARKEVLAQLGLPFTVEVSGYEEDMTRELTPRQMVRLFSREKARAVARKHPGAVVIGVDTIVVLAGRKLGKPKNEAEARRMLRALSGKTHWGLTGITVTDLERKKEHSKIVKTVVTLKNLSKKEIEGYVATGEPLSHAGAYAIQGKGAALVTGITGDYHNVAGLPLSALVELLPIFGVEIF